LRFELVGVSTGIDAAAGVIDDLLGFAVNPLRRAIIANRLDADGLC
jgi:hypothetical protein